MSRTKCAGWSGGTKSWTEGGRSHASSTRHGRKLFIIRAVNQITSALSKKFDRYRDRLLGSGDIFGEMALISGEPRRADVVASTYCRLLVLRKADFDLFMRDNRDVKFEVDRVAAQRNAMIQAEPAADTTANG
nr:cyclic nucleotide-binding domain-containing protein [Lichenifustis flavocetrariae]